MEQTFSFPSQVIIGVNWWVNTWTSMWRGEIPSKIHSRDIDAGGAPEWTSEFRRWIERTEDEVHGQRRRTYAPRNDDARLRTTRAFRKLRAKNPREYEVLYRTVVLRHSLPETAIWLTERAIRNDKPERYSALDAQILLVCAVDKTLRWW